MDIIPAYQFPKLYNVETSPATEDTNHVPLPATVPPTTDAIASSTKLVWKMMILLEMTKLVIAKIPDDQTTDPIDFDDYQTSPITTGWPDWKYKSKLTTSTIDKLPLIT